MELLILIIVSAFQFLICLFSVLLVYRKHKKRDMNIKDYRNSVVCYTFFSNLVGLFIVIIIGGERIAYTNSFESYFFPVLAFVITVLLEIICVFYAVFRTDKRYKKDTMKIIMFCSPYIMLLPIIYNVLVMLDISSPIP